MEKGLEDFIGTMKEALNLKEVNASEYSPLSLAYIGDAIYEVVVRSYVLSKGNMPVNKLHLKTSSMVSAKAQSKMMERLEELLTNEEQGVFHRGRNAKANTQAKNASISEYRRATGFEAVCGYLYLEGQYKRLNELIYEGLKYLGKI